MYTCVCRVVGGGGDDDDDNGSGSGDDDGGDGDIPMSATAFRTDPGQLRGDRSRRRLRPGRRGRPGLAVVLVPLLPITARMKARAASHRACASSSVRHDTTSLPFLSVFLALPTPPPSPPRSLRLPLIAIPARVGRSWRERELLSGSRSLNVAVTSRATILSKFAREKERDGVCSRLSPRN